MDPLEMLRQRLAELRSRIDTTRTRATEILSMPGDQLTPELTAEATTVRSQLAGMHSQRDQLEAQIRDEEADRVRSEEARTARVAAGTTEVAEARGRGVGGATVVTEERTYSAEKNRRGQTSFFADAYRATQAGDNSSRERLHRHATEMQVEGENVEARATTTASYAGLVVPQYLTDMFAPVLRAGRPLANRVTRLPLPAGGMTLDVPRGTTGAAAASQATQNSALQNTDQVWADLVVPVCTIGGQQDISRQSLERGTPGMDTIVFLDLWQAFNAELDRQVANGSGASGQMLGILQTVGIFQATAYVAAVTAATFYSKTAGAVAAVASAGTAITPDAWFMNPRRWYWLTAQLDSQGRPLATPFAASALAMAANLVPGGYSGDNDANPSFPVGIFHGLPVYLDANIPTAVGSGPEDQSVVMDSSKAYLWEDNGGTPRQLKFEQTLGQNLTVKVVLFNYAAFTAGRYPTAFGVTGGNSASGFGQVTPAF